jgi:regulator of replication initiation timing
MLQIESQVVDNNPLALTSLLTQVPQDSITTSIQKELQGVSGSAIGELQEQLKAELGVDDGTIRRLMAWEATLDKDLVVSLMLGTTKAVLDFQIGKILTLIEESLPEGYFDVWVSKKVPKDRLKEWQQRFAHWKQMQFAIALGAGSEKIPPEEFILKYPQVSSQVWMWLGGKRCLPEIADVAYALIRKGFEVQEFQLRTAHRALLDQDAGLSKEQRLSLAEDIIKNNNRSEQEKGMAPSSSPELEVLDVDYIQVTSVSEIPSELNEHQIQVQENQLETQSDGLVEENRRLRHLLQIEREENQKLRLEITSLKSQLESLRQNGSESAALDSKLVELQELPLTEIRRRAQEAGSIIDLMEIAAAFNITVTNRRDKAKTRQEILDGLPEVFDEQFAEA